MKKKIFVLIVILLAFLIANSAMAAWNGVRWLGRSRVAFTIAAEDTPASLRRFADFKCDGDNDQEEIQAAIDALSGNGLGSETDGGMVILYEGHYSISAPIYLQGYLTLKGAGIDKTVLRMKPGANCDMFVYNEAASPFFTRICYMSMFGSRTSQTNGSCIVEGSEDGHILDFRVEHVFIDGFKEDGIRIYNGWGHILNDVIIENCEGYGVNVIYSPNHIKIHHCKIISNDKSAIRTYADAAGSKGAIISGCELRTRDSTATYPALYIKCARTLVTDCLIGPGNSNYPAIVVDVEATNCIIANNVIYASADYCIRYSQSGVVIANNTFLDWNIAPIDTNGSMGFSAIQGNSHENLCFAYPVSTAEYNLTAADSGRIFRAYYNDGPTTFYLPSAFPGLIYTFVKQREQNLIIQAASGDNINGGSYGKKYVNTTSGEAYKASCTLLAIDNAHWVPISVHGTWANDDS